MEGADPQFWVAQEGIGKGQFHSAVAQASVTKEVSRIENKSAFQEVKVGTGETQPEENLGLLKRPEDVGSVASPAWGQWCLGRDRLCPRRPYHFSLLNLGFLICKVPNVTPASLGSGKTGDQTLKPRQA